MSCTGFTSKTLTVTNAGSGLLTSSPLTVYLTRVGSNNYTTVDVSGNRMTNIMVTAVADVSLTGGVATTGYIRISLVPAGSAETATVSNGLQTTNFSIQPADVISVTSQVLVNVPSGSYDIYADVVVNTSAAGTAIVNGRVNVLSVRTNL
jgi:hypothetical protein